MGLRAQRLEELLLVTSGSETLSDNDVFSNTYGIYGDFGGTLSAASTGNNRFVNNAVNGTVTGSVTQM